MRTFFIATHSIRGINRYWCHWICTWMVSLCESSHAKKLQVKIMVKLRELIQAACIFSMMAFHASGAVVHASAESGYECKIQPSATRPVNMIASVKIQFPEAKFLGVYAPTCDGVTLTSNENPTEVYVPVDVKYSDSNFVIFHLRLRSSSADEEPAVITRPGNYTLHIPARTFHLYGSWLSDLGYCEEFSWTYTVSEDGGDGYDAHFNSWSISPVPDSTVSDMTSVTISFPVTSEHPVLEVPDFERIRLRKADDASVVYELTNTSYDYESTAVVRFKPYGSPYPNPVTIMEPGEYILDIPAGTFMLSGTDVVNPAIAARYIVEGPKTTTLSRYTVTPAPGGTYNKISEITIEYPDLVSGFNFTEGKRDVVDELNGNVTLVRLHADEYYQSTYVPYSAVVDGKKVTFQFRNNVAATPNPTAETITANGDYLLTVPANTFKEKDDVFQFNPRIEAYFTINRNTMANPFDNYVLEPGVDAVLGAVSQFSVTFPEVQNGFDYPIDYSGIKLIKEGETPVTYKAVNFLVGKHTISWGYNTEDFNEDISLDFTEDGRYTVVIPAGIFSEYENSSMKNSEIRYSFTIDSSRRFEYNITPDPSTPVGSLGRVSVSVSELDAALSVNPDCGMAATITSQSLSSLAYVLEPVQATPTQIDFEMPENLGLGVWLVSFPAGYFMKTVGNGTSVLSPDEITARYRIVAPSEYDYSLYPASGTRLTGLRNICISLTGSGLKQVRLDDAVGVPVLAGSTGSYLLSGMVSENVINLTVPEEADFAIGEYTLTVPEGYVITTDAYGLDAVLPEIIATYSITDYTAPDFSRGIFFVNEGRYGTDFGSVNFLNEGFGKMDYNVFRQANKGMHLGVTSQYGEIFGDRMFIMSKQASSASGNAGGGVLVVADASTMEQVASLQSLGDRAQGRSFCGVNAHKAYLGTDSGVFVFHLADNSVGEAIQGTTSDDGPYSSQIGDMVRFGGYVFAACQGVGVYVIDTNSDDVAATIDLPDVLTVFVTAGGDLYAATSDASAEFVRIDSVTFETTMVDVEAEQDATLIDRWGAWTKAPLAVAISGNAVYYVTSDASASVARYDFDRNRFVPDFATLPMNGAAQQVLYGTGLSIDPLTGYLVLQAVESGGGTHYRQNRVYFANAQTGEINQSMTFELEPFYWFPAMAVYPVMASPMVDDFSDIRIAVNEASLPESATLDVAGATSLGIGNPHLIAYAAEVANPQVCSVARTGNGTFEVTALSAGKTVVRVVADYRGVEAEAFVNVEVIGSGSADGIVAEEETGDIYTITGVRVRHNVRASDTTGLLPGIYIFNNRKIVVR